MGVLMDSQKLIGVSEAAEILQMKPAWVRSHWRDLGGFKMGRFIRFFERVLHDYLQTKAEAATVGLLLYVGGEEVHEGGIQDEGGSGSRRVAAQGLTYREVLDSYRFGG